MAGAERASRDRTCPSCPAISLESRPMPSRLSTSDSRNDSRPVSPSCSTSTGRFDRGFSHRSSASCLASRRSGPRDELACRPGSVSAHLAVLRSATIHLGLPLPTASCGLPADSGGPPSIVRAGARLATGALLDLAPGGVYRAAPVARRAGGLLHHRFTLTTAAEADVAVCSLWHCPAGHPGWVLPTTLPFGARTFLEESPPRGRPASSSTASLAVTRARSGRYGGRGRPRRGSPRRRSRAAAPPRT